MRDIEKKVLEIAAIAEKCPEDLQGICFELLLRHSLGTLEPVASATPPKPPSEPYKGGTPPADDVPREQEDLKITDLHVKARKFVKKHDVSVDDLNELFYKEGDEILPLYEDLKTTRAAEGQIRIALLQSLQNAIGSGDFECSVEEVRQECKDRKYYDQPNFAATFKRNSTLFDLDQDTKQVSLTEGGKKELSQVIKELG